MSKDREITMGMMPDTTECAIISFQRKVLNLLNAVEMVDLTSLNINTMKHLKPNLCFSKDPHEFCEPGKCQIIKSSC